MFVTQMTNSVISLFADDMILYIENAIKQPNQKVGKKPSVDISPKTYRWLTNT